MTDVFVIELVLALAEEQVLLELDVAVGSTVDDAITASGLAVRFPELSIETMQVGIWGRVCSRSTVLARGQRIEIYRDLEIDPRDARRRLALTGRTMSDAIRSATAPDPSESR